MTPQGPDRLRMVFVAENFDGQLPPVPCSASMSRRSAAMSRLAACAIGAEVGCAQSVVGLVLNPELAEGKRIRNRAYARQRYLDKTDRGTGSRTGLASSEP
jgi:hypothetical protein